MQVSWQSLHLWHVEVGGPGVMCSTELASLTRCVGHGADRSERAITAPFLIFRGLLTVAEALHTRVESKWTKTSKIALICTTPAPIPQNALDSVPPQAPKSDTPTPRVLVYSSADCRCDTSFRPVSAARSLVVSRIALKSRDTYCCTCSSLRYQYR